MRKLIILFLFLKLPVFAQLNADFSASIIQGCSPLVVQFKDISSGGASTWFWDFGNGITSSLQNPVVTYTASGVYSVRLIIKNASAEDYEEKNNYITVYNTPQAEFFVTAGDSGCAPLQSAFKDTSVVSNTSVTTWLWNFGDSTSSNQQNPFHSYTIAGKYDISLTIQTAQGCSSTHNNSNAVIAGNKPVAAFSASPLAGCASTIRNFKDKSSGRITEFLWRFGDGGISYDQDPLYHYQDTGIFNVQLVVSENGCKDSATIPNYITVSGPVSIFTTAINCIDGLTVTLTDRSIDQTGKLWKFGDGQTSTTKNPVHTYNNPGVYTITLISAGITCSDTAHNTVYIKTSSPKVAVSPLKNIYCRNDSIQFLVTGYDSAIAKSFSWNFGDGIIIPFKDGDDTIIHVYTQNGKFAPVVFIKDEQRCTDSAQLLPAVTIGGPVAEFENPSNSCANSPVIFKDRSIFQSGVPITQALWSYGDGTTNNIIGSTDETYLFPGIYNANLILTDANGCTDSVTHSIQIFTSPIVDAGKDTFACASNTFILNATGATNYVWQNNNDLSCTQCANPVVTPTQSSTFFVTGTSNGCTDSDSVNIKVQTKQTLTAQPVSYTICEGNSAALKVTGTDIYNWLPDSSLSNITIQNPTANPLTNTTYTAIGKDSNNCFSDTIRLNVAVTPKPIVSITDSVVEVVAGTGYTIFSSAGIDAVNLQWVPASGLSCYNCLQPNTVVNNTITYTLTATNASGCTGNDSITLIALCNNESVFIPNTFSPNNDGVNDFFSPRSKGSLLIKSITIFSRWGQVIFQKRNFFTNNYKDGWDGKYKNVVQKPDVYVYLMELKCADNETFTQRGNISLIR